MLRQWLHASVISAMVLALAACGVQTGADGQNQNGIRTNTAGRGYGILNQSGQHQKLQRVASAIERIDGISRANVVLMNSDAYVTVELNDRAFTGARLGGTHAKGSTNASEFGMKGNYYGATDSRVLPPVPGWDNDRIQRQNTGGPLMNGMTGARGATPRNNGFSTNKDIVDMYGYGNGGGPIGGLSMNGTSGNGTRNGVKGSQNGPRTMESSLSNAGTTGISEISVLNARAWGEIQSIVRQMLGDSVRNVYVTTNFDEINDLVPRGPADNSFDADNPRHRTGLRVR